MRPILEAPDKDKAPRAMSILEGGFYHAGPVLFLPEKYRKRLRNTNSIERLNEELGDGNGSYVFSQTENLPSAWLGATLMGKDERWTTGKKYFDMEECFTWRESQISGQTHKVTRIF